MNVAVPTPAHADGPTGQGEHYHSEGAPCGAHRTVDKDADADRLELSQLAPCPTCMDEHGLVPADQFATDGGTRPGPKSPGIKVCNMARSHGKIDVNGGRYRRSGKLYHLANSGGTAPGWLGNPLRMDDDTRAERRRVIAGYVRVFLERVESDPDFREAVERLRGMRVGCWCRGISQDRTPDNFCHLDVVDAWLRGDLSPVYDYLRGGDA
jgi:hypothetical protein